MKAEEAGREGKAPEFKEDMMSVPEIRKLEQEENEVNRAE